MFAKMLIGLLKSYTPEIDTIVAIINPRLTAIAYNEIL